MTQSRYDRMERLKAVDREFQVVRDAVERLDVERADDRLYLPEGTTLRDLEAARDRLEATYLIRLWAEFEVAVRLYHGWLKNDPEASIRAMDLVKSVFASRRFQSVPDIIRLHVHEVRKYRNSLVHDRDELVPAVALPDARRRLNTYLKAKLPERWE